MTTLAARQMRTYFTAPVPHRLAAAQDLYHRLGPALGRDPAIRAGLERVRRSAARLTLQMQAMAMGATCSDCAARTGGGCCSAAMADNTDGILLLINMLLQVRVEARQGEDSECCFLGRRGCILAIKPIFCLNYNCGRIRERATGDEMRELERLAGRLLGLQTELEGLLLERIGG